MAQAQAEGRARPVNLAALLLLGALTMPQPWGQLVRRDHVLVAGMPGTGKTPLAASLAAEARRAAYFDTAREWDELGEVVSCAELADVIVRDGKRAVLDGDAARDAARELLSGTFRRVVFRPDPADLADDFARVVAVCRAAGPRDAKVGPGLVLLADELHRFSAACAALLIGLHSDGHKDGLATVFASPCMVHFPKQCRDTATRVFSLYQKNADDIDAMRGEYGDDFATRAAAWRYPDPPAAWVNPTLHT
jgi:hypothetical protein